MPFLTLPCRWCVRLQVILPNLYVTYTMRRLSLNCILFAPEFQRMKIGKNRIMIFKKNRCAGVN